jgi:hypothetical protein
MLCLGIYHLSEPSTHEYEQMKSIQSQWRLMEYQVHVYDLYHIPDDEDILPTYSPRNDQDLPSYDIALYSDPITEGEAPSYFCSRTSKSNDMKSNSVNGNSLIANTHADPLGERQTWAHDNTSRQKTADTLHPTERRMGLDGPSGPRPCFLLPFTNCLPQKRAIFELPKSNNRTISPRLEEKAFRPKGINVH